MGAPARGPTIADTYHWSHPWQLALPSVAGLLLTLAAAPVIHGVTFLDRRLLTLLRRSRAEQADEARQMGATQSVADASRDERKPRRLWYGGSALRGCRAARG